MSSKLLVENQIDNNNAKILEYRKLINKLEMENLKLEKDLNKDLNNTYNFDLNKQQEQAVKEINCNNIIIACPGSGKTHTLIAKVSHLINNEFIDPQKIIMITFTKKTAQEMNDRLHKKAGCNNLLHVGTLHGLAYRVLQKHDKINYTILDENDCHKSMRNIFEQLLKTPEFKDKYNDEVQSYLYKKIVVLYDVLMTKYPIKLKELLQERKMSEYYNIINKIFILYKKFKNIHKYLDFNDLMVKFMEFLNSKRSDSFKSSYNYILFDEYQDINCIQDLILRQLNSKCYNLTVVGDDAQAIYSFRGSEVKYIINFQDTYDNVKVHRLESNYRSVPEIVNFCNSIIKNNNNQLDKNMLAVKSSISIKPKITGFSTVGDEVKYIIGKIKDNVKSGVPLKGQVIITRKNRQLDNFELELIKNKINYVKSKGIGIMDRVHIKDFLAFLIILVNRNSIIHWKRMLSLLPGVGNVTVAKIMMKDKSMHNIMVKPHKYIDTVTLNKIRDLSKLYINMVKLYNKMEYDKLCDKVITFLKPIIKSRMTIKEKTPYEDKIDDLYTLKSYINNSSSIADFLADVHLNVEVEKKNTFDTDNSDSDENDDYLFLSTVHGAKGLEWDYVYFAGCSSDIIPSLRSNLYTLEIDDFEEERRLFYVGCSRARKSLELTLSYDYHFVSNQIYVSPFIKDLDPELYNGSNLTYPKRLDKGDVTHIINNYMLLCGSSKVYPYLKSLKYKYKSYYRPHVEPLIYKNKCELIYGTFVDNLITKIVHQEYIDTLESLDSDEYIPLDVPIYERSNINYDSHYYNYVDPSNDWQDILNSVLRISTVKTRMPMKFVDMYKIFTSKEQIQLYQNIHKMVSTIVKECIKNANHKKLLPKNMINLHHNISYGSIMGEADMVIGRTLIEIKTSRECIATTKYVLQALMYRYMLRKKDIRIDNIIMMNPLLGETYTLHITPEWKHNFRVFTTILE
jgi:DNA helicase-2/ATP-dependent DNA helicase PcrA